MDRPEDNFRLQNLGAAQGDVLHDLAGEAADLYAKLPAAAKRSLRAMTTHADDQAIAAAAHAAGRAIVQAGMDLARQRGRQAAERAYRGAQLPSEQAVETEAVRLAREAWAASR